VPGTSRYPLTMADIIANGYIRPLVQGADGFTGAIGTSIITGPSFRPVFESLDLIPDMSRADVAAGGADRLVVTGTGSYGGRATLVCSRRYPDPEIGRTSVIVTYTWTAVQAVTLTPGLRGQDDFRLVTLSSMLASTSAGLYDARYLAVTDPQGRRRTLEVSDQVRNAHLFPTPRAIGVGRSFALLKDNAATWNAGSPSIEVRVVSTSGGIGRLGVQGYRADTTDPNDDSLSVWLEWMDAPATVAAGTTLTVSLMITATPATDLGDLNHDGRRDCADLALLDVQIGRGTGDAQFDAYADLDRSGVVDARDRERLLGSLDSLRADIDGSGTITSQDFFDFLTAFFEGGAAADVNGDGDVSSQDYFDFLAAFFVGC